MMTMREFFETVINANLSDEVTEVAKVKLGQMDNANAKRRAKVKEVKPEDAELMEKIYAVLTTDFQTASAIAEQVGSSISKVSYLLRNRMEGVAIEDALSLAKVKKGFTHSLSSQKMEGVSTPSFFILMNNQTILNSAPDPQNGSIEIQVRAGSIVRIFVQRTRANCQNISNFQNKLFSPKRKICLDFSTSM